MLNGNVIKRKLNRIPISFLLVFIIILQLSSSYITVSAAGEGVLTSAEIMRDMGLGWNLGNSLDANGRGSGQNIYSYETCWGNPVVSRSLIDAVKARGFNTIRIPTTWYEHMGSGPDYTIDAAWMSRVREVVDYAIDNDMYVILNIHHEPWINRSDFGNAYYSISPALKAVWEQIATEFKDYDQHLIFEGMNEPRAEGAGDEWWTTDSAKLDTINKLDADFVSTVRSVQSPYQYTRLLMIPAYAATGDKIMYQNLVVPGGNDNNGDGYDDYVAVSIHAYKPYDFTMGDGNHSDFDYSYNSELMNLMKDIGDTFISKGIPVVIGEYSASNYDDNYTSARVNWASAYMTYSKQLGIPCVLWDNNKSSNNENKAEAHGYIDRSSYEWYESGDQVITALMSVYNDDSIVWAGGITGLATLGGGGSNPSNQESVRSHNALSSGSYLSIDIDGKGDGFISKTGKPASLIDGKEIAVVYSTMVPSIEMMDSAWGGYVKLPPDDFGTDGSSNVAYFKVSDILSKWNSTNPDKTLTYIKIPSYSQGMSGTYVLDINNNPVETPEVTTKIEAATIVDNGLVGVNFYMSLDAKASRVYVDGTAGTKEYPVVQLSKSQDGLYIVPYAISAKDMNENITVKVLDANGSLVPFANKLSVNGIYTSSLNSILDVAIADSSRPTLSSYCKNLKTYGEYASAYFKGTSATTYVSNVSAASLASYQSKINGSLPDGVTYVGSSLILKDGVTVRHYFEGDLSNVNVTVDGVRYTPVAIGNLYHVDITGIPLSGLKKNVTTKVGSWTITHSPYSYFYSALGSGDSKLVALVKAMCQLS